MFYELVAMSHATLRRVLKFCSDFGLRVLTMLQNRLTA
jgi:hypothetical protein